MVFFAAFTKLSGAASLIYITTTDEIWKDESFVQIDGEPHNLIESRALFDQLRFHLIDFITRISASCILLACCCQIVVSFIDYSVVIKHIINLRWFVIMLCR